MINFENILKECKFKTSRSGGAGGQHVNKVETKVEIIWNVKKTRCLSEAQKQRLLLKLEKQITAEGNLFCTAQASRSQLKNKEVAKKKLLSLIMVGLKEAKKRKPSKISRNQKEKRLKVKRIQAETKSNRKKVKW